jgi:UDP:flavonoid glycosyltransferase YjiC (YdhE family)
MKVTLIAIGTRGDVQPTVALGIGLRQAGHDVRVATHPPFEGLVRERGLDFAPVAEGDISRARGTEEGRKWQERDSRILPAWVGYLRDGKSVASRRLMDCRDACADADVVVTENGATLLGLHVAEKSGAQFVRTFHFPPRILFGSAIARQALWGVARPWVNAARRDVLALSPLPWRDPSVGLDRRRVPLLYAFSSALLTPAEDGDWIHVTGFWFLDRPPEWEPPAQLVEFLADGPPPVFVGFGSVPDRDAEETMSIVVEALTRAGLRGVVSLPSASGGDDLPPHICAVDSVWHDWLFPRVTAAVHHAGSGTMSAALRHGLPSVTVPHFVADQPFWARRIYDLGAGTMPIPRKRLSADRLAAALRVATTDSSMRERAAAIGEAIRSEDGVTRAVQELERALAGSLS